MYFGCCGFHRSRLDVCIIAHVFMMFRAFCLFELCMLCCICSCIHDIFCCAFAIILLVFRDYCCVVDLSCIYFFVFFCFLRCFEFV